MAQFNVLYWWWIQLYEKTNGSTFSGYVQHCSWLTILHPKLNVDSEVLVGVIGRIMYVTHEYETNFLLMEMQINDFF